MSKTALILAAGLGTRLKEHTQDKPKALVEINGKPLLEHLILKMQAQGFDRLIINVHHFAEQVIGFLERKNHFGLTIHISDERNQLLDTGGAILKAKPFLQDEDHFLVHNVDAISNIDLNDFFQKHIRSKALATMAVRDRITERKFLFDKNMLLKGWQNSKTQERILIGSSTEELKPLAFSGIHGISTDIFQYISSEGAFSIVKSYLQLAENHIINGIQHNNDTWLDVGKPEQLELARKLIN